MHEDPALLGRFLKRHVVRGKFKLAELVTSMNVVNGFKEKETEFFLNSANSKKRAKEGGRSFEKERSGTGGAGRLSSEESFEAGKPSEFGSFAMSDAAVHYLYPERALINNLVEDLAEKSHEKSRDYDPFVYDKLDSGEQSQLAMAGGGGMVETSNPFEPSLGLDGSAPLPHAAHDTANPGPLQGGHADVPTSELGPNDFDTAYRLYTESPPAEMQHLLKLNKIRYRLPYGFQYTTFGGADLRTLENPEKRLPVYLDGNLEDQYYYGQGRRVCVSNKFCSVERTSLCWNGYVHLISGVMTP